MQRYFKYKTKRIPVITSTQHMETIIILLTHSKINLNTTRFDDLLLIPFFLISKTTALTVTDIENGTKQNY